MKQPPGFIKKGEEGLVCKLRRSIYGLKQSARCWNQKLHQEMDGISVYLLVYVDDILLGCKEPIELDRITKMFQDTFEITVFGEPSYFLGLEICKQDGNYSLSLEGYIEKVATRFGLQDAKGVKTPMEVGFTFTKNKDEPFVDSTAYRSLVGALLYIAVCARPDVAVSASILGRKVSAPMSADWIAAKRVLRFLKSSKSAKLRFNGDMMELVGYSDADWAGDSETRRSTTGYVFMYGGAAISWCSRLQRCVTLSSMESEYIALGEACQEIVWLRRLLADFEQRVALSILKRKSAM